MVWLRGGASHIDSYDMKPDAPAEIRGEFQPIATNVPASTSASTCRGRRGSWTSWRSFAASGRTTWATTRRTTSSPAFRDRATAGVWLDRQPCSRGRTDAAVRQPDVRAAGALRQRRADLYRPGPSPVRARAEGPANLSLARTLAGPPGRPPELLGEFDTLSREVDPSGDVRDRRLTRSGRWR